MLRGEERLWLRRDAKPEKTKRPKPRASRVARSRMRPTKNCGTPWRARRLEFAKKQGVPPYVVFHDATLAEMVARRPQTLSDLAHVSGVGERKLAAYGADFIAVIRARGGDGAEAEAATGTD